MRYVNLGNYKGGKDLPDVRYHPSVADRVLEGLALLPVLALWGYVLARHLRGGEVGAEYYVSGILAAGCYVLLFVSSRCSVRHINFPFRVHRGNVVRQYVLVLRLVRVLNVLTGCLLVFSPFMEAGHRWAGAGFALSLVLLAVSLAGYMVLAYRQR